MAIILSRTTIRTGALSQAQPTRLLSQWLREAWSWWTARTLDYIIVAGGATMSFAEFGLI
ncbi:hypothetical protein [Ralstonia pseudosolanacearum]|uniref:hypothetical protein n=1 Tax=Ralstonia pseudosolanacearum TaxID=1310165 RepID=UPI0038B4B763